MPTKILKEEIPTERQHHTQDLLPPRGGPTSKGPGSTPRGMNRELALGRARTEGSKRFTANWTEERANTLDLLLKEKARRAAVELARNSPGAFREYVLKDSTTAKKITLGELHREWDRHIADSRARGKWPAILAPFGSGKSTQIAIGKTLEELGKNPELRIKIICNAPEFARDRVMACRTYIEEDEDYHELYPHIRPGEDNGSQKVGSRQWTQHRIFLERKSKAIDPSLEARGIFSAGISGRADILIFDDALDANNSLSPAKRMMVDDRWDNVWLTRLEPTGWALVIGTRWHKKDKYGKLLKNPAYSVLTMSIADSYKGIICEVSDTGRRWMIPLWEARWGEAALRQRRIAIGEVAYKRGFLQQPIDDSDLSFPSFSQCLLYGRSPYEMVDPTWPRYTGVDLSSKKRPGKVIFTLARSPEGRKIPLEIKVIKATEPVLVREIVKTYKEHNPRLIYVENNALQETILEWITELGGVKIGDVEEPIPMDMPITGFFTGSNKHDSTSGLPGLEIEFSKKAWTIAQTKEHDVLCKCPWCRYISEMEAHPAYPTTDILMASWFASEASKAGGDFLRNGLADGEYESLDSSHNPHVYSLLGSTEGELGSGPDDPLVDRALWGTSDLSGLDEDM